MVDKKEFQLIVVGGGINGAGIARDASLRGINTLLLEKDDFGQGATGGSTGMIHGGLRYMLSDITTTKKSCLDSGYIQKIAPHLLFRIPFLYPVKADESKILTELIETYFETYDYFAPLKNGKQHTRLSQKQLKIIEPKLDKSVVEAITMDEFGIDSYRLTVANAISAKEAGAIIKNHTKVIEFIFENNRIIGVKTINEITKKEEKFYANIIFNASGPWLMKIAEIANVKIKIRPSKGVHLVTDRRFSNNGIVVKAIDGRSIFIMPHENNSIIGTTDDDYFGDLDNVPVLQDEVEYLLASVEQYIPDIRKTRILRTYYGIRPTLYKYGVYEDDLSRDHKIYDHKETDGIDGLLSIAGGKLAAYRIMSEEAVDLIGKKLHIKKKTTTHIRPLPGGDYLPDVTKFAEKHNISPILSRYLIFRHGSRAERIINLSKEIKNGLDIVCSSEQVTKGEIIYVVREEDALTISDVSRRTRYGMGIDNLNSVNFVADIIKKELGKNSPTKEYLIKEYLDNKYKLRFPALKGTQLAQEEIIMTGFFNNTTDF